MADEPLAGILAFLRSAERLKDVTRTAWTSEGRQESVAEHSWRLCLMALVLGHRFPEVDLRRWTSWRRSCSTPRDGIRPISTTGSTWGTAGSTPRPTP